MKELRAKLEEVKEEKKAKLEIIEGQKMKAEELCEIGNYINNYLNPKYEKALKTIESIEKRKNSLLTDSVLLAITLVYLDEVSNENKRDEIRLKIMNKLKEVGCNSYGSFWDLLDLVLESNVELDTVYTPLKDSVQILFSILNEKIPFEFEGLYNDTNKWEVDSKEIREPIKSIHSYCEQTKTLSINKYLVNDVEEIRIVLFNNLMPEIYKQLIEISKEYKEVTKDFKRAIRTLEEKIMNINKVEEYTLALVNDIKTTINKFDYVNFLHKEYRRLIDQSSLLTFFSEVLLIVTILF